MNAAFDRLAGLFERRPHTAAVAVIVLASAVFFSPFLFGGKVFLAGDTLYNFFPWRSYVSPGYRAHNMLITDPINHNYAEIYNRQLKEGGLSEWAPQFYTGLPATGISAMQGAPGRSYPVKRLLHRFLPTLVAHDLLLLLHVTLMGLAMYLFLTEIGAGARGALFGSVAYMFNGTAMVWLEFETVVAAYAFLPLALFCMERFRSPRRYFYAFAGAAMVGVMALMGHIQFLIYTFLLLGFYLLFLVARALRDGGGPRAALPLCACFAILCAGSGLVAALDLVPVFELVRLSSRVDRTFTFESFFNTLGRVPFRYYVTLIFPDYFGNPALHFSATPGLPTQEYMNYCELTLYAGVPILFAILGLAVAPRTDHGRFFGAMTLLLVLMLSGTFAYYPFFALVPGMNKMNPTRLIFLFNFAFAAAAGLGLAGLGRLSARGRAAFLGLALALELLIVALAFGSGSRGVAAFFNSELAQSAPGRIASLASLRGVAEPIMLQPLLISLFALALAAGLVLAGGRKAAAGVAFALLVALLAGDLIRFGRAYNTTVEPRFLYARTPAIDFLLAQPKPFRVVQHGGGGFGVNTLGPFGIEEVGGYSSFYPKSFNRLVSYLEWGAASFQGRLFDRWVTFFNLYSPIYNLLDAKYFLVAPGSPLRRVGTRLVYRGEIDIYENTAALPRAYPVHSFVALPQENEAIALVGSAAFDYRNSVVLERAPAPGFTARADLPGEASRVAIERYGNDEVRLSATMAAEGLVVLSNAFYPGWSATVDGKPAPILRANVNYQAVVVPAGNHAVVFAFRPAGVRWGSWAALAGSLFILGGMFWFSPLSGRVRNTASAAPSKSGQARA